MHPLSPLCILQSMISARNNRRSPEIPIRKILIFFFLLPKKLRSQRSTWAGTCSLPAHGSELRPRAKYAPIFAPSLEKHDSSSPICETKRNSLLLDGWAKENLLWAKENLLYQHPHLGVLFSFRLYKGCLENKAPNMAVSNGCSSKHLEVWLLSTWT